jgi:hypothetical protein
VNPNKRPNLLPPQVPHKRPREAARNREHVGMSRDHTGTRFGNDRLLNELSAKRDIHLHRPTDGIRRMRTFRGGRVYSTSGEKIPELAFPIRPNPSHQTFD